MKQIRRSLNKDKERTGYNGSQSPPLPSGSGFRPTAGAQVAPPSSRLAPPKLVIRATSTYRARAPNELSFSNGDFFHVVSDPNASDSDYFDAANPATGARGLVPKSMFQVLGRNEKETSRQPSVQSSPAASPGQSPAMLPNLSSQGQRANGLPAVPSSGPARGPGGAPPQSLYGVVQYDFEAQRNDELEARKGDPIIIIAQSNHEWFVAKPIGRLGGPGLIPVSFVEIQNMATGKPLDPTVVNEMIRGGALPPVEEWKKMTAEYKQQSIPLGRFDFASTPQPSNGRPPSAGQQMSKSQPLPQARQQPMGARQTSSAYETSNGRLAPNAYAPQHSSHSSPALVQAQDDRASYGDNSRTPSFQPEDSIDQLTPENAGETLGLVIQAAVESFHFEEGAFWFHVHCAFSSGASYIIYRLYEDFHAFQVALMKAFPVEAGRELPPGARAHEPLKRIIPMMPGPAQDVDEVLCAQRVADLSVYLSELCHLPQDLLEHPIVYDFFLRRPGDLEVAPPPSRKMSGAAGDPSAAEHDVVELLGRMPGGSGSTSRATGDANELRRGVDSMRLRDDEVDYRASQRSSASRSEIERQRQSGARSAASQHSLGRSTPQNAAPSSTVSSRRPGSYGVTSPVSTAPTSASTSASLPHQPAGGPSPAFIKIKIFHRSTDDLIAIRVPPNVTFNALLDKARDRLGEEIGKLRFKEEIAGLPNVVGMPGNGARLVEIANDNDLQRWLSMQAKLILYADRA